MLLIFPLDQWEPYKMRETGAGVRSLTSTKKTPSRLRMRGRRIIGVVYGCVETGGHVDQEDDQGAEGHRDCEPASPGSVEVGEVARGGAEGELHRRS